jgi:serine phosphatase RsbU (regulator of sigma subunit)/CheY-like chemotaxis protein
MKDKVLLVDDDAMVLAGLKRQLRNQFSIDTALSGEEALQRVRENGPYAVIISDYMMPGMNGVEFLSRIKRSNPETIRMMLTGTADMPTAIKAVNEGNIFQFHPKPCPTATLSNAIQSGLTQYKKTVADQYQLRKVKVSLAQAGRVQQKMLPKTNPQIDGFDIAGKTIMCDETGGDYYDFFCSGEIGAEQIGIVVGDVTDHGIPSALLMSSARAFLRDRIQAPPAGCASIISDVNKRFVGDVEELNLFMTMFYCEIATKEKIIRWVKAGHEPAILYEPADDSFENLGGAGLPLGVMEDAVYKAFEKRIRSGQIILIQTDGIKEASSKDSEIFGTRRLLHVIRRHAAKPAREILDKVFEAMEHFCHPLSPEDDATLVVIKVL